MSHYPDRLRALTEAADQLVLVAPDERVSALRREAARFAQATARMGKAIDAAPGAVATLQVARFTTAAEGALSTMQGLMRLIGHGARAEAGDPEAERGLSEIVDALVGAADAARAAAVRELRTTVEASVEATASWRDKIKDEILIGPSARMDALTEAFLNPPTPAPLPAVQQVKKSTFAFWKRAKAAPAKALTAIAEKRLSDEDLDALMKKTPYSWDEKSVTTDGTLPFTSGTHKITSPVLAERGLVAEVRQSTVSFMISDVPPQVMTPVWERLAKMMCGDPEALRKALILRNDPDFRSSIRDEALHALNGLTAQTTDGNPVPLVAFRDPILGAAICTTLVAPTLKWHQEDFTAKGFDPFGFTDKFKGVETQNPGIMVSCFSRGLFLTTSPSAVTPTGLSAMLHASVRDFKAQIPDLRRQIYDRWREGVEIRLPEAAMRSPYVHHSAVIGGYIYGNVGKWNGLMAEVNTEIGAIKTKFGMILHHPKHEVQISPENRLEDPSP